MTENQSAATEVAYLPHSAPPTNHGHTVAAWVTMIGLMIAAFVATSGAVIDGAFWLFWAGLALGVVSLLAGAVLKKMGLGQK